ncbi:MAG: oligopeptide ABC transporter permease [Chloroflexota bacterium]
MAAAASDAAAERHDTLARLALRRFLRHRLALIGFAILAVLVVLAVLAPWIAPYDPTKLDLRALKQPPSPAHLFGTDTVGYDVFSRFVWGARTSLIVGFGAVTVSVIIGTTLGVLAGYYGGWVDALVSRAIEVLLSLPALLLVAIFVSVIGPSLQSVIIVIALMTWPQIARLVRGQYLVLREAEFITAVRVIGASDRKIILRHLLPNVLGPLSVAATFYMAMAILLEASLSFLGLGVKPPAPSWGNMVALATNANVLQNLPWVWVPAAVAIALVVLAINFVGDGLRDAVDPRGVRRA